MSVSNVGGLKGNAWYNLSCLLQTYCHLSTSQKLSVSNVGCLKGNAWYNLSHLLQTYCHLRTKQKLSVSLRFFETCGVSNNPSAWSHCCGMFCHFSSRWHLCVRRSPYAFHPVTQKLPQRCQFQCWFDWRMAVSRPFKGDRLALPLATPLSSRRSMAWCPWLCARR